MILAHARELAAGSTLVFPGRLGQKPLSDMVFLMLLLLGLIITARGFRSSFRDWAAERTSHPREVAEMAPAHAVRNRVEAAYVRIKLLDCRRDIIEEWARFICPFEGE